MRDVSSISSVASENVSGTAIVGSSGIEFASPVMVPEIVPEFVPENVCTKNPGLEEVG